MKIKKNSKITTIVTLFLKNTKLSVGIKLVNNPRSLINLKGRGLGDWRSSNVRIWAWVYMFKRATQQMMQSHLAQVYYEFIRYVAPKILKPDFEAGDLSTVYMLHIYCISCGFPWFICKMHFSCENILVFSLVTPSITDWYCIDVLTSITKHSIMVIRYVGYI